MPLQYPTPSYEPAPQRHRSGGLAATGWSLLFAAVLLGGILAPDLPGAAVQEQRAPAIPQVVRQVVKQQLDALAAEDAGRAFALAAPDLRTQFGSAEAFLATMREEYPMLLHPSRVLFLKPATDGRVATQKVRLTDDSGSAWSLLYLLNRQQDDQWRITACVVTAEGRQVQV